MKPLCTAAEAGDRVPKGPGYYAIFIDAPRILGNPYRKVLAQGRTKRIYIGIATRSLQRRLVKQDLLHQKPSTFFRGIGAILGYRPLPGSLAGRKNQNNYKFRPTDTAEIIGWIYNHLLVSWLEAQPALEDFEELLIGKYSPILNTLHNRNPVQELATLRLECRTIAKSALVPVGWDHNGAPA